MRGCVYVNSLFCANNFTIYVYQVIIFIPEVYRLLYMSIISQQILYKLILIFQMHLFNKYLGSLGSGEKKSN